MEGKCLWIYAVYCILAIYCIAIYYDTIFISPLILTTRMGAGLTASGLVEFTILKRGLDSLVAPWSLDSCKERKRLFCCALAACDVCMIYV